MLAIPQSPAVMRAANEQTIPEELAQKVADLTARVAELSRRLELTERIRGNGNGLRQQQTDATVPDVDGDGNAIEFVTDNGFTIVRPWEQKGLRAPAHGVYRFRECDPRGDEREISVEISNQLVIETSVRTRGRIQVSSSFWICCAERRLANYVIENDRHPEGNQLIVETLDCEEILLAKRWEKSG